MSNLAYIRVSTVEQNLLRQEVAIKENIKIDKWFLEKASAKNRERPELNGLLDYIREGDSIYIHSLDRLARNTKDLLNIVETLDQKKVKLYSIKDNFDFNSSTGKFMMTILGAVAELEYNITKERRNEGIALAKKKGIYKGRKPVELNKQQFKELYLDWEKGYITKKEMAKRLNISRSTLYRRIKKYNKKKNDSI